MMFVKFNPITVLQFVLCLRLLTDWCFVKVTGEYLERACIHNATESSKINITCQHRIEVVSIYYDHRHIFSGCALPLQTKPCHKLFETGLDLRARPLYHCSHKLHGCQDSVGIGQLSSTDCSTVTTPFNFVMMTYHCLSDVPAIVGSVIGGIVLIIIIIIVGVLVYRNKRREKSPSRVDSFDTTVDHSGTNNEVYAQNQQTYPNIVYEERASGCSSVRETEGSIGNGLTPPDSLNEYDKLHAVTVFHTSPHQGYKATYDPNNDSVTVNDHKTQTKGGHNALSRSVDKHPDYDILENKANLNSASVHVEPLDDDTYNHIGIAMVNPT